MIAQNRPAVTQRTYSKPGPGGTKMAGARVGGKAPAAGRTGSAGARGYKKVMKKRGAPRTM